LISALSTQNDDSTSIESFELFDHFDHETIKSFKFFESFESSDLFNLFEHFTFDHESDASSAKKNKCDCINNVSNEWKENVSQKKSMSMINVIRAITRWKKCIKICYAHDKWMNFKLELMMKTLNNRDLKARLIYIHNNRTNLVKIKVDDFIFIWFRISHRLLKQTNSLESYRFFHANHASYRVSFIIVSFILRNEFDIIENVIIFELYDWWWEIRINTSYLETIMIEIATLKFNMYCHHFRVINEKENYEW
jgi:hypothetical protein